MPTLAEGVVQLRAEIADAEARLAAAGDDGGDRRYREWMEDQLRRMHASLAALEAAADPPSGTV